MKLNQLAYDGPILHENLKYPKDFRIMVSLSQTIYSEKDGDKKCKKYPYKNFEHYKACDEESVYEHMKRQYPFLSFAAAKNLNEVTIRPR